MQNVTLAKRRFVGPERFEDLTTAQLLKVIALQRMYPNRFLAVLEIVKYLFRVPAGLMGKLTDVQAYQLGSVANFLFETPKFERWFIKTLPGSALKKFYGPGDGLDNITFNELMHADQALDKYAKSNNQRYLAELAAVLYRPAQSFEDYFNTGDRRAPFNVNHTAVRADLIEEHISGDTLQAIRLNYVACRAVLAGYFTNLFPAADPDELQKEKPAANANWLDLAIQLARKEPALGDLHDIERDNAYLVCRVLDQVIKEYNELEAEREKIK